MQKSKKQWNRTLSFVMAVIMLMGIVFGGIPIETQRMYAAEPSEEEFTDETVMTTDEAVGSTDETVMETDAVITNTDTTSEFYLPNTELYEWLLQNYDIDSDGILMQSEIRYDGNLSIYDDAEVSDFTGLSKVAEGIIGIYADVSNMSADTKASLFEEIKKMEITVLDVLGITQADFPSICQISSLEDLTINQQANPGSDFTDLSGLSALTNLTSLCIADSGNITVLPENTFVNMTALTYLQVTDTLLTNFADITHLSDLEYLNLWGNRIEREDLEKMLPTAFAEDEDWWDFYYFCEGIVTTGDGDSKYNLKDEKLYELTLEEISDMRLYIHKNDNKNEVIINEIDDRGKA